MYVKKRYFLIFVFLCCFLYHNELSKYAFFVSKGKQLMKILEFSFSGKQEKKILQNFVGIYFLTLEF